MIAVALLATAIVSLLFAVVPAGVERRSARPKDLLWAAGLWLGT